jgi:Tfp pilus assembly protein PilP
VALKTGTTLLLAIMVALLGCQDQEVDRSGGRGEGRPKGKPAAAAGEKATAEREPFVFKDEDFVESVRNRDPFRSYSTVFKAKEPEQMQREVVMPTTDVEEMRLIAIVTGIPKPKAMLLDPAGVGHVVERGDYLGRPKVLQAAGSVSMTLNWRVDRIRDNEVVLTQQDPTDPNRFALTKIIALKEEIAQKL